MKIRFVLCGILVATLATPKLAMSGGGRQSVIVENRDGSGTTIVKVFEDIQQEWTILNLWPTNQANGVVREADGSTVNISCSPTLRTNQEFTLSCFPYDTPADQWSPVPIVTTVGADFLNGPYVNDYNSLFELPGEFVTIIEFPGFSESYRVRLLDAAQNSDGVLFLIGQTLPATPVSFLFRNTDLPDGTAEITNFTFGMQTDAYCIDVDVTPAEPGGNLAGTFGVRERGDGGTCGEVVTEDRSATLVPSGTEGVSGTYCPYIVEEVGECTSPSITPGVVICLPCSGECRDFTEDIDLAVETLAGYTNCTDVVVEPQGLAECSRDCQLVRAVVIRE